jgi:hypothetical protein
MAVLKLSTPRSFPGFTNCVSENSLFIKSNRDFTMGEAMILNCSCLTIIILFSGSYKRRLNCLILISMDWNELRKDVYTDTSEKQGK